MKPGPRLTPALPLVAASGLCLIASIVIGRATPGLALSRWVLVLAALALFALAFGPGGRRAWLAGKPVLFATFAAVTLARAWPYTVGFAAAAIAAVLLGAPGVPAPPGDIAAQPAAPAGQPGPPVQVASRIEIADAQVFGQEGSAPGEFREPHGIAVAPDGAIIVADSGNKRVQVLDKDGKLIREITGGDAPFKQPFDVAVAPNGEFYVLDSERPSIERFDREGKLLASFGGDLGLYFPRGLALDAQGNLYVADTGGSRVLKLSPAGAILFGWGEKGRGQAQFTEPTSVAVADDGTVYAIDPTNRKLSMFKPDGAFVRDVAIDAAGTVNGPKLALGPDGALYASAPEQHVVRKYSRDLQLLGEAGGPGQAPGQLRLPTNLGLIGGELWVSDTLNHRLQRLTLK